MVSGFCWGKLLLSFIRAKKTKIGRIKTVEKRWGKLAVRTKVEILVNEKSLETIALLNSGDEAEAPQALIVRGC